MLFDWCGVGKCQFGDMFVGGQCFVCFFVEILYYVKYFGWEQIVDQFQQQGNVQWCLFCWFEYYVVFCCQGWGQFLCGYQQWEVLWDNLFDYFQWFMEMIGYCGFVNFGGVFFLSVQVVGEVVKMIYCQWQVSIQGFVDWFFIVLVFCYCQIFQMLFNMIGDLQQQSGVLLY